MNELSAFERRLAAGLEAYAGPRRGVDADAIARTAANRLPLRRSILLRLSAVPAPAPRLALRPTAMVALVAVLALALALAASVVIVGNQPRRLPAVTVPAGNGLIAYSSDGDIHVGNWETRQTKAIVSGTTVDSSPKFSPDGTRIAFVRGDPWTADAILIVVRVDGSDERVVMPAGYSQRGLGFAWTPDSASLVVNHDSKPFTTPYFDGELSLVDASGVDEPRLITPPLPKGPGGGYFGNVQAAPMFRPPNGDHILSSATGRASDAAAGRLEGLYAWDADLVNRTQLAINGLERYQPYYFQPWALWWSPDGSMIAFELGWGDREPFEIGTFVMHADGTAVRPLEGVEGGVAWSPDGSKIAYQRGCPDPSRQGAVVVVHDLASGAERVLEATAVETKYEGDVSPLPPGKTAGCFGGWIIEGPEDRAWDYEGWSWSPDGRSIVMLESSGTRPMVVDVETGQATELPWEADSAPSWQRILPTGPG
jgi:dipeptidyl aminopeptidase/acylaminoacyl peptidase